MAYRAKRVALRDPEDRVLFFVDGTPEGVEWVLADAMRHGQRDAEGNPMATVFQDGRECGVNWMVPWLVVEAERAWEQ